MHRFLTQQSVVMNAQKAQFPFTISLFFFNYFYWDSSCMSFITWVHGKLCHETCSRSQLSSWGCKIFNWFAIEPFIHWYKSLFHDLNTLCDTLLLILKFKCMIAFDLQGAVRGRQIYHHDKTSNLFQERTTSVKKGIFYFPLLLAWNVFGNPWMLPSS